MKTYYKHFLALMIVGLMISKFYAQTYTMGPAYPVTVSHHTGSLLNDGRVLIAGGAIDNAYDGTTACNIYDPTFNTWTAAAPMNYSRNTFQSVVLKDGRVLVAGGLDGLGNYWASAEIYNPLTNTWTVVAPMSTTRYGHTMILLQDGRVLVVGCYTSANVGGASYGEVYDPVANTWTSTPNIPPRSRTTLTLLPNGKVLMVAGLCEGNCPNTSLVDCELYDPTNNTWTVTGSLTDMRCDHQTFLLPNNKVITIDGWTSDNPGSIVLNSTEIYDIAAGTWTMGPPTAQVRIGGTAVLLPNNKIAIFSGFQNGNVTIFTNTAEIYDYVSNSWSNLPNFPYQLFTFSAMNLHNGRVLFVGGRQPGNTPVSETTIFDYSNGDVMNSVNLNTDKNLYTQTLLPNEQTLLAGGGISSIAIASNTCSLFNGTWTATGNLAIARLAHTATLLSTGNVLVTGGNNAATIYNSCELYTYNTGTWSAAPSMNTARTLHTATLLMDGRVMVTGGSSPAALNSCEIYNLATNTWVPVANMNSARFNHKAILLTNGQVLVTGGQNGANVLSSSEVYDPCSDTWTVVGNMITGVQSFTMNMLENGTVLVTGGSTTTGNAPTNVGQLYNPATSTWTTTGGNLTTARCNHASTLLFSGVVLITGGWDGTNYFTNNEIYDPVSNTFKAAGTLNIGKINHRATLLPNNQVLIGPGKAAAYTNVSDLYDPFISLLATGIPTISSIAPTSINITNVSSGTTTITVNGQGFRDNRMGAAVIAGIAATGATQCVNTATNHPVVQIMRIGENDNGTSFQSRIPFDVTNSSWTNLVTDVLFPLGTANNRVFAAGVYNLYVVVSGVPSLPIPLTISYTTPTSLGLTDTTICASSQITLTANNADFYLWNTGATTNSITVTPTATTTYSVKGCSDYTTVFDTAIVTLGGANTVASFTPVVTPCNETVNFTNTSTGAGNYSWNFGDGGTSILTNPTHTYTTAGTYLVTLIAGSGVCADTATVNVTISSAITVNLGPAQNVCSGASITLDAGNPGDTYLWSNNLTTQSIVVTTPGTYYVTVTDGNCTGVDSVVITYTPGPVSSPTVTVNLCPDTDTVFNAGNAGMSYLWSSGDTTQTITAGFQGVYFVRISVGSCTVTDTFNLNVYPELTIIQSNDTSICPGAQLTITADGGSRAASYSWNPGGEGSDFIIVNQPGTYIVYIKDIFGCITSRSILVGEFCFTDIYIPSAFTPNGDGINDLFQCLGDSVIDFHIYVFDRWGELLFQSTDIAQGWDGTYMGSLCPQESYVYRVDYQLYNFLEIQKHTRYGAVTLIR